MNIKKQEETNLNILELTDNELLLMAYLLEKRIQDRAVELKKGSISGKLYKLLSSFITNEI